MMVPGRSFGLLSFLSVKSIFVPMLGVVIIAKNTIWRNLTAATTAAFVVVTIPTTIVVAAVDGAGVQAFICHLNYLGWRLVGG